MVRSSKVPDLPTKRLPVVLSSAITGKPRRDKPHGECPLSPRQIAKVAFQHLPDSVDTSLPGILSSAPDSADKVHLHYHDKNDGGARLVGNRVRTKEGSVTRDYVFILYRQVWYLEPVSDTITGIRPMMQKGDVGPPEFANKDKQNGQDLEVWEDGKCEVSAAAASMLPAAATSMVPAAAASMGPANGFRSRPATVKISEKDPPATRKSMTNSATKFGPRKSIVKAGEGSIARKVSAGKSIPGVGRGDVEKMEVSDDDGVYDGPKEATDVNGRMAGKSVGHKSVGGKGLDLDGQGHEKITGGPKGEHSSGGSGSESGADSFNGGSSSAGSSSGSSSDDSVDYTDQSSEDGGG